MKKILSCHRVMLFKASVFTRISQEQPDKNLFLLVEFNKIKSFKPPVQSNAALQMHYKEELVAVSF